MNFNCLYSNLASAKLDSSLSEEKPCLEKLSRMTFEMNIKTENAVFGPTNYIYKKKTEQDLIATIEWFDADNANAKDDALKSLHESNKTRLLDFEQYKEDEINKYASRNHALYNYALCNYAFLIYQKNTLICIIYIIYCIC